MIWAQPATFDIVLIFAIASPRSAMLMATQTLLSAGRTAGIAVGAGLGQMAAMWTMMALLGFGVVFELFPVLYVGAKNRRGYLSSVHRVQYVEKCRRPCPSFDQADRARVPAGFLVNLFNPKSVLFAAAVLVTIFPAGIGLADRMVIEANHFLVEMAFYTALAFGMSTQAVAKRYMRARIYIDRAAAAVLGTRACVFHAKVTADSTRKLPLVPAASYRP